MASVSTLSLFWPVMLPASAGGAVLLVRRLTHVDWITFFTGPGRISRILLLLFIITNWKSLPLAWTVRVFTAFVRHTLIKPPRPLPPRALFHYIITSSRNNLLETDYNMHKSNATYFSDLDVSRSHVVTRLLRQGMADITNNGKTKLVRTKTGGLVNGAFGIGLGAVACSFKKEVGIFQKYEMWTRILAWDRKWLYLVTHFVAAGKVKPPKWDDGPRWGFGPTRKNKAAKGAVVPSGAVLPPEFEKFVIATAISKYVFKLGRFTVHPSILIEASALLPPRDGEGWRGGPNEVGDEVDLGAVDLDDGPWDWKKAEHERRRGMEFAQHFAALDGMGSLFDGGEDGSLGRFALG